MRLAASIAGGLFLLVTIYLFAGAPSRAPDFSGVEGDAVRGAYVVRLAGCVSCHTRPKDGVFLAGGEALETPFGKFYGPNITSDETHGLGNWTRDEFANALLNGKGRSGHLYPVFPFPSYVQMSEQDLADLWAYLQTVDAASDASRPHELSNPLLSRLFMRPWKTLFFSPKLHETDPNKSEAWNRGRYIVEGIGHCAECHRPRNSFGVLDQSGGLDGGVLPPKGEKVPALTPEALKDRGYERGDLLMAFQWGMTPDGDVLGGSMGEVVSDQLGHLTAEDLEAIATYLLED